MLLQEIFKPEYQDKTEMYGLEIDEESTQTQYSRPPEHFETLGFKLVLDHDNLIDEKLLDLIISYSLTNMNIVVEVPTQLLVQGVLTPKDLILLSMNVDFSLSLLPPNHPFVNNSITDEQYIQAIKAFYEEMQKKQNYEKFVAPISNFLEYLMLEKLLGKEHRAIQTFSPDNLYVQDTFTSYMTLEQSNAFKDVLRQSLYDFYGGEAEFDIVAQEIFKGIYDKSKEIFTQHVSQYVEQERAKTQKI